MASAGLCGLSVAPAWAEKASTERDQLFAQFAARRVADLRLADDRELQLEDAEEAKVRAAEAKVRDFEAKQRQEEAELARVRAERDQAYAENAKLQIAIFQRTDPAQAAADRASADKIVATLDSETVAQLVTSPLLAGRPLLVRLTVTDEVESDATTAAVVRQLSILTNYVTKTLVICRGGYDPRKESPAEAHDRAMSVGTDLLLKSGVPIEAIDWDVAPIEGLGSAVLVSLKFTSVAPAPA